MKVRPDKCSLQTKSVVAEKNKLSLLIINYLSEFRFLRDALYGGIDKGIKITDLLTLAELEFADDAGIPDENANTASERLTTFDHQAKEQAGMEISLPKTKVQHIMKFPNVSATTEDDVTNLPPEMKFKFECDKCDELPD